jgi:hypothetical protein
MRPSDKAWLTLAAGVTVWDALCPRGEMLSEASSRYAKARPLLWNVTIIYVAGHLMHVWPQRCDPLSTLARSFGR